jgi:glycosyltransferase involved in cell wall biosynthesis
VRVLHLAPLWFPVSKNAQGGIETYLAHLISALERQGCRNHLLASGDSSSEAELIEVVPMNVVSLMVKGEASEYVYYEQELLLRALSHASDVDVVHSHVGWSGYVLSGIPQLQQRILHTQHNPVTPDLMWFVERNPDLLFSAVSEFQARKMRDAGARRCYVVHNGIDVDAFTFSEKRGEEVAFLGRIEAEKGAHIAIDIARRNGLALNLAGPISEDYFFDEEIKPFLDGKIRYLGVLDHQEKNELLGRSLCLLMPSVWDEPFGMVAVEAMACGTPVVATASGALPEVVDQGVTGFIGADPQELGRLVEKAAELDRRAVRKRVAQRFDLDGTAKKYVDLYRRMAEGSS